VWEAGSAWIRDWGLGIGDWGLGAKAFFVGSRFLKWGTFPTCHNLEGTLETCPTIFWHVGNVPHNGPTLPVVSIAETACSGSRKNRGRDESLLFAGAVRTPITKVLGSVSVTGCRPGLRSSRRPRRRLPRSKPAGCSPTKESRHEVSPNPAFLSGDTCPIAGPRSVRIVRVAGDASAACGRFSAGTSGQLRASYGLSDDAAGSHRARLPPAGPGIRESGKPRRSIPWH